MTEHAAAGPDGCTTFGLLPAVTADGHTWLGQNWDWLEGVHGRTFVLQVRRKGEPSFVCLTEAGIAGGKMGVNECGIGLVENGLASSHDGRNPYRKPFHVRCREVLDARRFDEATRPVTDTPRTCSANFVIGAAGGEIVDLESAPTTSAVSIRKTAPSPTRTISWQRDMASRCWRRFHPTRSTAPIACESCCSRRARPCPSSTCARRRATTLGAPFGICRHPDPRQPAATRTMTVGAVLIDLEARTMHVANGPPCSNDYVAFSL